GPNGSPTNTGTFKIYMVIQLQGNTYSYELDIKGQSDTQGGTVCAPRDNGSPQTKSYTSNGTAITETVTTGCSGTYKGGQITYNEILEKDDYTDANGDSCTLNNSVTSFIQITGSYTTFQMFSGNITQNNPGGNQYTCIGNLSFNNGS